MQPVRGMCVISAVLVASPVMAAEGAPAGLDERLSKGEVVVEHVSVPGSPQPAIQASMVLDAPPDRVFAIVDDCANYAAWMPRIVSSSQTAHDGEKTVCRWTVHMPFPMSNKSTEVAATSRRSPGVWTREFTQLHGDFARNEGLWTLTNFRGDPQRTRIDYHLLTAVNVMFPEVFVKSMQRNGVLDMVKSLRERLGKLRAP